MPEDIIEKTCHKCRKVFNWEYCGCYVDNEFFCENECAKEVFPKGKHVEVPYYILVSDKQ